MEPVTPSWPRPVFDPAVQPHYLVLLTLPYSGSTAIAKLLESSASITGLTDNCEGQRLVPGLYGPDRWDAGMPVDPDSIRAVWLSTFQQKRRHKPGARAVIEKSPPNMMRLEKLAPVFGSATYLVNNREPYAQCASFYHRRHDAGRMSPSERDAAMIKLAQLWIARSAQLRRLVLEKGLPVLTYETFCASPELLAERFNLAALGIHDVNAGAEVRVKNYPSQPIVNQNPRQVADLTARDKSLISSCLERCREVVTFFGYELQA